MIQLFKARTQSPKVSSLEAQAEKDFYANPCIPLRSKRIRIFWTGAVLWLTALWLRPAHAWDPATTHLGLTEQAALKSALHVRWMLGSEQQRGLFSSLRVIPSRLPADLRRHLHQTLLRTPEDSGAFPLGGPGACPGPEAPPITQKYCVEGDLWQLPAIFWLELGVLAEMASPDRAVHHFVAPNDPSAKTWKDQQISPSATRRRHTRYNEGSLAGAVLRTGFAGEGPSVVHWLEDDQDVLAPKTLYWHLERAYLAEDPQVREHHFALALLFTGALLHVAQDLSVPAHARGDLQAFFAPLSSAPGDRGLPVQEYARVHFERTHLPLQPLIQMPQRKQLWATSIAGHLFATHPPRQGIARFTAQRFLSEGALPPPQMLDSTLSAEAAAQIILQDSNLDPVELKGAFLDPWPSERGYVKTSTGRPLAAFQRDASERMLVYFDEVVWRQQILILLPQAVSVSRSLLDFIWPSWPAMEYNASQNNLGVDVPADVENPVVLILHQNREGHRKIVQKVELTAGKRNRISSMSSPPKEGERTILVFRGHYQGGEPWLAEYTLAPTATSIPAVWPYESED